MCDSVEHRVTCFQLGRDRVKQGKPSWAYTVNLKAIIERHGDEELTDALLAQVCNDIAKELKAKLPASFFDVCNENTSLSVIDIIESLEAASVKDFESDRSNGYTPVELVDGWLNELYTWCDLNRIWVGG